MFTSRLWACLTLNAVCDIRHLIPKVCVGVPLHRTVKGAVHLLVCVSLHCACVSVFMHVPLVRT